MKVFKGITLFKWYRFLVDHFGEHTLVDVSQLQVECRLPSLDLGLARRF